MSDLFKAFRLNERLSIWATHLIVCLMMACFAISLVQVGQRLVPGWNGAHLIGMSAVVALESLYTGRRVRRLSAPSLEWAAYRIAEWVLILIGLKAAIYWVRGVAQFWVDAAAWPAGFADSFFNGEYMGALLVVIIVWAASWQLGQSLMELEGDADLLVEDRETLKSNRVEARQNLATAIFGVGAVMLVCFALVRFDLGAFGVELPALRASALNVLFYFVLGLALMSQSQFAILRAGWSLDRISISPKLASRWTVYSLVVLIGLAAVAGLLPTIYSLSLLDTLAYLLGLLLSLLALVLYVIVSPVFLLLNWIMSLFGRTAPVRPVAPPPTLPPAPATLEAAAPMPWLELLKSLLFWIVLIGAVGISFYHYFRQHPELVTTLSRLPGWRQLAQGWRWLWERLAGVKSRLAATMEAGLKRLRSFEERGPAARGGFISLKRLSPRERVLFFYLAMVRRGSESGLARRPSQTPHEYLASLEPALPEAAGEINSLTDAFVEARYSRHEITTGQADRARQFWERIKQELRGWRLLK